ncbi:MAG: LLM class F420-dependent oxidoreductase [Deltaproteobacteria bacterium]|nr:LLM class F420-dependent oxidoreductase [Deltaproteobacteria bacterium]
MRFGLFGINIGPCASGQAAARVARAAEAAGFESVWTGEHVVLPDPQVAPSPMPPQAPMLDPAVALTVAASTTTHLRLGTGIIILPQRNPLVLAKELASVDVVSDGRLIVGIGVGYLEPEFAALGIPFTDKGARTDEYLAAMRALWTMEHPVYSGRFVRFAGIDAHPRPVQRPHPPVVIGGRTPPAFRRAVRSGNGWYGFALDVDDTAACVDGLRQAAARDPRPAALGELEVSVTPRGTPNRDTVARFAALGVERLIVYWPLNDEQALLDRLHRFADEVIAPS